MMKHPCNLERIQWKFTDIRADLMLVLIFLIKIYFLPIEPRLQITQLSRLQNRHKKVFIRGALEVKKEKEVGL